MDSFHNRTTSIDRASVETILTGADQPTAVPSPHIGTSPNRVNFSTNQPARPILHRDRALSYSSRRPNRLSLTFPVAPSNGPESARATPTSSNAQSIPGTPAESNVTSSPNDANGFLVALASQERRVLELKEELDKAEGELKQLKKQWASHEATKKRAEIRHNEKLQPLQTARGSVDETTPSTPKQSIDTDRRKAFLANLTHPPKDQKNPRRKIITGGHTRALSLLSPERLTHISTLNELNGTISTEGTGRGTTIPDTSIGISKANTNRPNRHSYQGALGVTNGMKQITEDVKAGLWTFLEDLRQATVGDEAVNGTANKRSSLDATQRGLNKRISKGSLRGRRAKSPKPDLTSQRTWDSLTGDSPDVLDLGAALWKDPGALAAPKKPTKVQKKAARPISFPTPTIDDDDWSNWDSPTPRSPTRWSGSSTLSGPVTPGNASGEDEVNIIDQSNPPDSHSKDGIQWPALDQFIPGTLKKTVSTMMQELENSLTPPPADTQSGDLRPFSRI
ncbi:hypothetical protein DSL72_002200 [Monilinia vaccinii-corymbosi]|uniref:DUF4048 domain-containing protein n=1 Tax=Monilinia vaccinii-corymbosi TaxID=61207 RepID=A0A8A3PBZ6_9HELO|nr:hypothetical protein DSL72_002200 [Monilinia vaccinii-corymbosi]